MKKILLLTLLMIVALMPTVVADNPFSIEGRTIGDDNAPVTIEEFTDFECPYCNRFHQDTYPLIREKYIDTGKVRIVLKHFPLENIHPNARNAHAAAECVAQIGEDTFNNYFVNIVDYLFDNQGRFSLERTTDYVEAIGLNADLFNQCYNDEDPHEVIDAEISEGQRRGVSGTPTFFVNGKKIAGAVPYSTIKAEIEAALNNQNVEKTHLFIVDDSSPTSDAELLVDLISYLEPRTNRLFEGNYESKLNSEVKRSDLDNRVTLFIYKGEARIIVGANSPESHALLAVDIATNLQARFGVSIPVTGTRLSSEVTSDDLKRLFDDDNKEGADLAIKDIQITPQGIDQDGRHRYSIKALVKNIGDDRSGTYDVRLDVDGIHHTTGNRYPALNPGQTEGPSNIGSGSSFEPGQHVAVFTIIPHGADASQSNNVMEETFSFQTTSRTCDVSDTLQEGEKASYIIDGDEHEVELLFMDHDEAVFVINGIKTSKLKVTGVATINPGGEALMLQVKSVLFQDYAGGLHQTSFCLSGTGSVTIVQPDNPSHLQITDIDLKNKVVESGQVLLAQVEINNKGNKNVNDIKIELSIPHFDVRDTEYINEIQEGDQRDSGTMSLRIPKDARSGTYKVVATVTGDGASGDTETVLVTVKNRNVPEPIEMPTRPERPSFNTCDACLSDGTCLPFGTRFVNDGVPMYCDIDKDLHKQKGIGGMCQNNYECSSNQCSTGECVDLVGELQQTRSLLKQFFNWLSGFLGANR